MTLEAGLARAIHSEVRAPRVRYDLSHACRNGRASRSSTACDASGSRWSEAPENKSAGDSKGGSKWRLVSKTQGKKASLSFGGEGSSFFTFRATHELSSSGSAMDEDSVRKILDTRKESFVLCPEEVEVLMAKGGFETKEDLLLELVKNTAHLSLPPISNFHVSCAALGSSGRVYIGVNIEFRELPLPSALHAEQFLVMNAFQHQEEALEILYISHVPCGHCRQFMCELHRSEHMTILINGIEGERFTLPQLLPLRFTPRDLIGDEARFLFQPRDNELRLPKEVEESLREGGETLEAAMAERALKEANASYAPYSNCPSGLCLSDASGNLYGGCLVESAAYNPTVSPLHSALVNGLVNGLGGWEAITQVTLVEAKDAAVKHEHVIRECLKFICPGAKYTVLPAEGK